MGRNQSAACCGHWLVRVSTALRYRVSLGQRLCSYRAKGLHPCSTLTCGTSVKFISQGTWSLWQAASGRESELLYQF